MLPLELLGDVASLVGDLERANQSYQAALEGATRETDRRRIVNKRHRPRLASRDGARIAFYEHGSGEETLLFMNPIVYGLEIFQPVLENLCQEFRIITVDPRGTGNSDPQHAGYGTTDHAADVRAVIEAAGGGPVTGIGISKSSSILVRLAVTAPGARQEACARRHAPELLAQQQHIASLERAGRAVPRGPAGRRP